MDNSGSSQEMYGVVPNRENNTIKGSMTEKQILANLTYKWQCWGISYNSHKEKLGKIYELLTVISAELMTTKYVLQSKIM